MVFEVMRNEMVVGKLYYKMIINVIQKKNTGGR